MSQELIRDFWVGIQAQAGEPAQFLKHVPVVECTLTPRDVRFIPKELMGSRIRERTSVRVRRWEEWSIKSYLRFDMFHQFAASSFNLPTTTQVATTPVANIQNIAIAGTLTAGSFRINVGGYWTAPIAYNATLPTIDAAVKALPSVRGAATVAGTVMTAMTLTFSTPLHQCSHPLAMLDVTELVGVTTAAVTHGTAGKGTLSHVYKGGSSNVPLLTIVYFDGVSYKLLIDSSISSADYTFTTERCVEVDMTGISKFEKDFNGVPFQASGSMTVVSAAGGVGTIATLSGFSTGYGYKDGTAGANGWQMKIGTPVEVWLTATPAEKEVGFVTAFTPTSISIQLKRAHTAGATTVRSYGLPVVFERPYFQPLDPTQLAVSLAGSAYADLVQAKLSVNQNREPFHTIGTGIDLNHATEGEYQVAVDAQAEYNAYTGSLYEDFLDNTLPGALVITGTDTATAFTVPAANPQAIWNLPRIIVQEGTLDSNRPNVLQNIKGYGAYSVPDLTGIIFTLVNEEPNAYAIGY